MGAMKRFAEEVSIILGKDGEITDTVLIVSGEILKNIKKVKKPHTSNNPKFIEIVEKANEKIIKLKELIRKLKTHDEMVETFHNDPMTEAMGAPIGDFQSDFDKKERKILADIIECAPDYTEEYEMALDRMDKWMP
jgi:hypothetical protein